MKGNILGAFFLALGAGVVASERGHLTTPIAALAGGCLAFGGYLLDSSAFKQFVSAAIDAWRTKGGGNG